jgi:hypothetical protein
MTRISFSLLLVLMNIRMIYLLCDSNQFLQGGECVNCAIGCKNCDSLTKSCTCEENKYLLLPSLLNCTSCSATQTEAKVSLENAGQACAGYPINSATTAIENSVDLTKIILKNACSSRENNQTLVGLSIIFQLVSATAYTPSDTSFTYSNLIKRLGDLSAKELKFIKEKKILGRVNATTLTAFRPYETSYISWFCVNKWGLVSQSAGTKRIDISSVPKQVTILLLPFNITLNETQNKKILCFITDYLRIIDDYTRVRDSEGKSCEKNNNNVNAEPTQSVRRDRILSPGVHHRYLIDPNVFNMTENITGIVLSKEFRSTLENTIDTDSFVLNGFFIQYKYFFYL